MVSSLGATGFHYYVHVAGSSWQSRLGDGETVDWRMMWTISIEGSESSVTRITSLSPLTADVVSK